MGWKGPSGRPMFNFRSDERSFEGLHRSDTSGRALRVHQPRARAEAEDQVALSLSGQRLFRVAGLIKDGAFAMLTTEPGEGMAPITIFRSCSSVPRGCGLAQSS